MKVLKNGRVWPLPLSAWKIKVTCRKYDQHDKHGCGAELEVGLKDLVIMYHEGTHSRHHYAAVRCPQCGKHTHAGRVPDAIWKKIFTARARESALFDGMSEAL